MVLVLVMLLLLLWFVAGSRCCYSCLCLALLMLFGVLCLLSLLVFLITFAEVMLDGYLMLFVLAVCLLVICVVAIVAAAVVCWLFVFVGCVGCVG